MCGWIDKIKQLIHTQSNTRKCMIESSLLIWMTNRLNEFKMHFF